MRKKYLNLTEEYNTNEELKGKFKNSILISGSDQLWGLMPNEKLDGNYYLNFGDNTNKYISFSSSFGRYDFEKKQLSYICDSLLKYESITVREKSAVSFLKKNNFQSKLILDPTLIVNKDIWLKMAKECNEKNYVLVYKLRQDKYLNLMSEIIAKEKNLKIIYVTNTIFNNNKNGKNYINKNINVVLGLFKSASYVVTDSFHATVFSVIFEKNFYTHLPGKTNSRIVDFLEMLNLSNRIFDEKLNINDYESIDYEYVNKILESKQSESIQILKNMFNIKS